jgi:hypothetical protein
MTDEQQGFSEQSPEKANGGDSGTSSVAKTNGADVIPQAWDGLLSLRKEVIAHGETVMEIRFREPTAGDIERIGNPITVALYENNPKMHFEAQTMTMMMAHLASVPPSTIRQMHPRDWNNGAWKLANFFMPDTFG